MTEVHRESFNSIIWIHMCATVCTSHNIGCCLKQPIQFKLLSVKCKKVNHLRWYYSVHLCNFTDIKNILVSHRRGRPVIVPRLHRDVERDFSLNFKYLCYTTTCDLLAHECPAGCFPLLPLTDYLSVTLGCGKGLIQAEEREAALVWSLWTHKQTHRHTQYCQVFPLSRKRRGSDLDEFDECWQDKAPLLSSAQWPSSAAAWEHLSSWGRAGEAAV